MLSYRHAFHAGNYADVVKHATLVAILDHLCLKDKAFAYLETHAGAGRYDLSGAEAMKTGEYQQGFQQLVAQRQLPPLLARYCKLVDDICPTGTHAYPGSPLFASQLARAGDKLSLCELHPTDGPRLQALFARDRRVRCYQEDGYAKVLSLLPPASRRGLVMIDPAYEVKTEYQQLPIHLKHMVARFATGTYAIWYPIADEERTRGLVRAITQSGIRNIQQYELGLTHDHGQAGMTGTGMLVINPPWTLMARMTEALNWLVTHCYPDGYAQTSQLVAE